MDLSIIIISWNTRDLLLQCLESIYSAGAGIAFETLVVDNASTDGSPEAVRQAFPPVKIIENIQNVGFGRANNQGFASTTGRFVLLLNSDTRVCPGAIQTLLDDLNSRPAAGANGPRLLNWDLTLQSSCYPFPTLGRELWRLFHLDRIKPWGVYCQERWNLRQPREVDAIKGACILFRREALEQAGGFDPDFFMYTEEIDLCYRVKAAGWHLWWVPQSEVIHYGGQSTRLAADEMFLSLYHTKILFFRKHYGNRAARVYKLILRLAALVRICAGKVAGLEPATQRILHREIASRYARLWNSLRSM